MSKNLNIDALGPARLTKMLLGAAVLILMLGGGVVLLLNSQIGQMQSTIRDKENQVGSNEQIARRYQSTLDTYNATLARTQYLEASVSAKSFVPTLLKQLQGLAAQTHLTVQAVRPGAITSPTPPAPKPAAGSSDGSADASAAPAKKAPPLPYDTIDIGLDVNGSYADTLTFLYDLTRFPKIVSVAGVQFHPTATAPDQGPTATPPIATNMHLTAFVFHDDGAATPPAAAPSSGNTGTPAGPAAPPAVPVQTAQDGRHFSRGTTLVSAAAGHAAAGAVGATEAANARAEAGNGTL